MERHPTEKSVLTRLSGPLFAGLIRLVKSTSTTIYEPPRLKDDLRAHRPFILAMWHGQFMMLADLNSPEFKVSAIVSRHGDAELIAATLERFDIDLIRGAGAGLRKKDRGGAHAFRAALHALEGGSIVAMTADVPTGQPRSAGNGIVMLARLSGRPIIPVAAATSRFCTLNTWSNMTINLPFSTLAFVAGKPLFVPANAEEPALERARIEVERGLNIVTTRAYELADAKSHATRATPQGAPHRSR